MKLMKRWVFVAALVAISMTARSYAFNPYRGGLAGTFCLFGTPMDLTRSRYDSHTTAYIHQEICRLKPNDRWEVFQKPHHRNWCANYNCFQHPRRRDNENKSE